jgi:hypothetical protein
MKKWLLPKIVATLALVWVLIWILWTAILFILSPKQEVETNNNQDIKLSPEQLKQLKDITWTWVSE